MKPALRELVVSSLVIYGAMGGSPAQLATTSATSPAWAQAISSSDLAGTEVERLADKHASLAKSPEEDLEHPSQVVASKEDSDVLLAPLLAQEEGKVGSVDTASC